MPEEPFPLPSCFFSDALTAPSSSSHHRVVTSTYATSISGLRRMVSITWSRTPLSHSLFISFDDDHDNNHQYPSFKLDLKPWRFWRRHGSKHLSPSFRLLWDLRSAHFSGDPDPHSDYYVALLADHQLVLLLGDLRKEALRRVSDTFSLPPKEPVLVSRKEHALAKRVFATRTRFGDLGKLHEVAVEVVGGNSEMSIRVDGAVVVDVKRLQWKFRGNQSVWIGGVKVEVCWDVHDWVFGPGVRHGLFVFKPAGGHSAVVSGDGDGDEDEFCLFLHAWKVE